MSTNASVEDYLRREEPSMISFVVGKSSYILTLPNNVKVAIHKARIEQRMKPIGFRQNSKYHTHTHSVNSKQCWGCGLIFCRGCMNGYGNWYESYCGC